MLACILAIYKPSLAQQLDLIGPPGGWIRFKQLGIQQNSPSNVFAANASGSLFSSVDGGINVYPIESNFKDYIINNISPHSSNSDQLYLGVVFYSLRSTDKGTNWEVLNLENYTKNYFAFNSLNENIVYMVRNTKEIWRSDDNGENWYFIYSFFDEITAFASAQSDTSILYCAADSDVYKSTDSGWSWLKIPGIGAGVLKIEVNPYNSQSVYYKQGGLLSKMMNEGLIINTLLTPDVADFTVSRIDTNIIYVSQYGLLKTTNEGNSWFSIVNEGLPNVNIYSEAIMLNPQNHDELYAGINALGVYKTTNGGNSWMRTNLSYSNVFTIYIDPGTTGHIITGQYGWGIMYTFDDGKEWIHPEIGIEFQNLRCRYFSFNPDNDDEGLAAAFYGIYKTTDKGRSWFQMNTMDQVISVSYHPYFSNIIFISREFGTLLKSIDGGSTWYQVSDKPIYDYVFHPNDPNIIYALSSGDILKSSDLGESWELKNNGISNSLIVFTDLEISIDNPEVLYCSRRAIGTNKGELYETSDGGENWTRIDSALRAQDYYTSVSSILLDKLNSDRIYIGLLDHGDPLTQEFSNGGLYLTEDGGINWRKVFDSEVNVIKADNSTPRNIYIGTKFGVMKFLDTLTVTNVLHNNSEIPSKFSLSQNYPNPFNPVTVIKYEIPGQARNYNMNVQIKVYDILGNEIATLVNEEKPAGSYEVEFDGSNLASGIYIYRLTSGNFTASKKLILLK